MVCLCMNENEILNNDGVSLHAIVSCMFKTNYDSIGFQIQPPESDISKE